MNVTTAKWTIDDYHRMIQVGLLDDRRVELLNGEIVEMSPEGESHAYYCTATKDYLTKLLGNRATIREAKPITIPTSYSEPEPDKRDRSAFRTRIPPTSSLSRQYLLVN